jgi:hypothetical protein
MRSDRPRHRAGLAGLAACCLIAAAPAGAQVPGDVVRVEPDGAGAASHLLLDLRVSEDPKSNGQSPAQAFFDVASGFRFDALARKEACPADRAATFDCSDDSRIGTGDAQVTVTDNGNVFPPQQFAASVRIFLGPPQQAGDLASMFIQFSEPQSGQRGSATGRLVKTGAPYGVGLRIERLADAATAPDGFRVRLDRIRVDVGASYTRKKKAYRYVRKNGKKRKVAYYKKVRHDLVRNPGTCGGSWPYRVRLVYPSGAESTREAAMSCRSTR